MLLEQGACKYRLSMAFKMQERISPPSSPPARSCRSAPGVTDRLNIVVTTAGGNGGHARRDSPRCARHYGLLTSQLCVDSPTVCTRWGCSMALGAQHIRGHTMMCCLVDHSDNKNCAQLPPARSLVTHPSPSTSSRPALPLSIICFKPIPFPSSLSLPLVHGASSPDLDSQLLAAVLEFFPRSMTAPGD